MRFSHCTLKVFKTGFKWTRQHGALTAADDFRFRLCETYPARLAVVGTVILVFAGAPVAARDPGQEAYMIRMLACRGPDAKMEVYLPQSAVFGPAAVSLHGQLLAVAKFSPDIPIQRGWVCSMSRRSGLEQSREDYERLANRAENRAAGRLPNWMKPKAAIQ
jgi:hypothetical protein